MSTTVTGIGTISLVCLPTIDLDRSIAFYESIGFEKRRDEPFGGGQYRWVEVYPPNGTTGIALAPPPGKDVEPYDTGIILTTDNIDATHAQFKALGVDVDAEVSRMGDPVPPIFWFNDPAGYRLMVTQPQG